MTDGHPEYGPPLMGPSVPTPNPATRRWRFRWGIVWLPAMVFLGYELYGNMTPGWTWRRMMSRMGIVYRDRFTALVLLAAALIALLLIVKIQCFNRSQDD